MKTILFNIWNEKYIVILLYGFLSFVAATRFCLSKVPTVIICSKNTIKKFYTIREDRADSSQFQVVIYK